MTLDPNTMAAVTSLAYVVLALWLVLIQATQRTYPGFRSWLLGTMLQSVSFLWMAGTGVLPGIPDLPNAMVVGAAACFDHGLRVFAGRAARPTRRETLGLASAGLVLLAVALVDPPANLRVLAVSALLGWFLGRASLFAWRELSAGDPVGARIVAAVLGASTLVVAARATYALLDPGPFRQQLLGRGLLDLSLLVAMTMLSMFSLGAFLLLNLRRAVTELEGAREQVSQLEGLITLCMHCRRLRDEESWLKLEQYMARHSSARFSHGLCPECAAEHYADHLGRS